MNALRRILHLSRWLLLGIALVAINPWHTDAEQAGSVAVVSGRASATDIDGVTRLLADGAPIYAGDLLVTGSNSYADIDFEDGGMLTLRPLSRVRVDAFHFEAASHDADQSSQSGQPPVFETAVFHLLKGGFRAISGLIGHISHDDYVVVAPTATLGIRGTEYDLRYCQNDCGDEAENGASPANGLYASVNKGAIALRNEAGESEVAVGQAAIAPTHQQTAYLLAQAPAALRHMALPPLLAQRAAVMSQRIEQRRMQRPLPSPGMRNVPRYVPRLLSPREPPPPIHAEPASRPEPQRAEPARLSPEPRHETPAPKYREQSHQQGARKSPGPVSREPAQGRQEIRGQALPGTQHGREPPATVRQPQPQLHSLPSPQPQTRVPPPFTRTMPLPRIPAPHPPASRQDGTRKPHQ